MPNTNDIGGTKELEQFEVIFYDEDEKTVLDRQLVSSGEKVVYTGAEPFKEPINGVSYKFVGWTGEENLESVTDNLALVAKYEAETNTVDKENALLKASLENARNTNLNATVEAGQKVSEQQKATEKDSRTSEEIVNEIITKGKTEIGIDANKDNVER